MKLDNKKYIIFKYANGLKPMTDFCETEDVAIEAFDKLLETDGLTQLSIANINHNMRLYGNFDIQNTNGNTDSFCLAEVIPIDMGEINTTEQEEAYAIINEKEYYTFETNFHLAITSTLLDFIYKDHKVGDELITDVVGKLNRLSEKFSAKYKYKFKDYKMIKVILP